MSQQINLFNPVFLKQKKYFSTLTMAQALGLILAGALVLVAYAKYELTHLTKEADRLKLQLNTVQTQLTTVSAEIAAKRSNKTLENEIRKVETEIRAQKMALSTLRDGDFGNTSGYSEYMKAFARQIINGLWLTGFSISGAGADIQLQGRALQPELVPIYINRLKQEPAMQGKSFATLAMQVPQVELTEKTDQRVASPKQGPASFIEFTLKSSEVAKGKGESSGESKQ